MTRFHVGDLVKCVRATINPELVHLGKIYQVVKATNNELEGRMYIYVRAENGKNEALFSNRFELIDHIDEYAMNAADEYEEIMAIQELMSK